MHRLEGQGGELELDVTLNWEPVEFTELLHKSEFKSEIF